MKKKVLAIIIFTIVLIFTFIYSFIISNEFDEEEKIVFAKNSEQEIFSESFKVDIKGAIKNPGVYEMNTGDRVFDLIEKAGGLLKNSNTNFINLSKELSDEMVIWIYTDKEIEELKIGNTIIEYIEKECNCPSVNNSACINNENNSLININKATLNELMNIPGVGESKAKLIIQYREKSPFNSIEDIKNVNGIGDSTFDKIKEYITI